MPGSPREGMNADDLTRRDIDVGWRVYVWGSYGVHAAEHGMQLSADQR